MTHLGLLLLRATVVDPIGLAGPGCFSLDPALLVAPSRDLPERMGA